MAEIVYPPVVATAHAFFRYLGLKFDVRGSEHVPRTGGAVMVINHVGYLDFALAGWAARPAKRLVRFMAKEAVFRHKISGPLMRGMHHIPVDRDAGLASFRAALAALKDGEIVGVFPEATVSRSFELKEFKAGAVRMARSAGVPILPTIVWGSQRIWTKGRKRNFRRNHIPISVWIGEPIDVAGKGKPDEITDELYARMAALLAEAQAAYPDTPSSAEDAWWLPARLGGTAPTPEEAIALDAEAVSRRKADRAARLAAQQDN
jgi:1-acyl-sn-glycerol-3-phosphate acyltransferase